MAETERPRAQRPGLPFVKVPTTVVRDSGLSVIARLLYSVIASYADLTTLQATILRGTLAEDIGRSRDTLDRAVAELVKANLLLVEPRRNQAGVPISSLYTLTPPIDASSQVTDGRMGAATPMGTDAGMGMSAARDGRMGAAMGTDAATGYGHGRGEGMGTHAAGVAASVRHITRTKERESVNETGAASADALFHADPVAEPRDVQAKRIVAAHIVWLRARRKVDALIGEVGTRSHLIKNVVTPSLDAGRTEEAIVAALQACGVDGHDSPAKGIWTRYIDGGTTPGRPRPNSIQNRNPMTTDRDKPFGRPDRGGPR